MIMKFAYKLNKNIQLLEKILIFFKNNNNLEIG